MERRAREGMEEETLQRLRRGWLLGGEGFRDRVLDWMEQRNAAAGQKRKIRREETDADHGQRQAERIIQEMMGELLLTEAEL